MNIKTNGLNEYYVDLVNEYAQDMERSVMLARFSADDPFRAMEKINNALISEVAKLKVQVLDLDLKVAKLSGVENLAGTSAPESDNNAAFSVYGPGDAISLGAGVVTYGFHPIELTDHGYVHRWSGPSTRCGFVALIDRAESLSVSTRLTLIDESLEIKQVSVDGELVSFKCDKPGDLHFSIPALKKYPVPLMTHVSILLNKTFVVSDIHVGAMDHRRVGINLSQMQLSKLDPSED
jgi:hypothetical protein